MDVGSFTYVTVADGIYIGVQKLGNKYKIIIIEQ